MVLGKLLAALLSGAVVVAAACADGAGDAGDGPGAHDRTGAGDEVTVVTTTSILGDIARNALGEQVAVEVLIPNGADPHAFEPSAEEAASLREADLIVANGVGLEEGLADTLDSVEEEGVPVLRVGDRLAPVPLADEPDVLDPHVWMDIDRMSRAASLIVEEAKGLPGVDAAALDTSLAAYQDELAATDEDVQATLAVLPDDRRLLVTDSEALGYFADRYGFELVGEVGGDGQIVELYTEALGEPGSGADSYTGLMTTNARRIADALM